MLGLRPPRPRLADDLSTRADDGSPLVAHAPQVKKLDDKYGKYFNLQKYQQSRGDPESL